MPFLYLMRHGQAEPGANKADEDRELTDEGHRQAQAAGLLLAALPRKPTRILCSPRTRAVQTAEHVAAALGLPYAVREAVNFSFNTGAVGDALGANPGEHILFVGHQPTMSEVIMEITGARVVMETASMACVYMDTGMLRGELVWFVPPDVTGARG